MSRGPCESDSLMRKFCEFVLRFEKIFKILTKYVRIINDPNSQWTDLTNKNLVQSLLTIAQADENLILDSDFVCGAIGEIPKTSADVPKMWICLKSVLESILHIEHINDFEAEDQRLTLITEEDWGQWIIVEKNPDLPHPSKILPKFNEPEIPPENDEIPLPSPEDEEFAKARVRYAISGSEEIRKLSDWISYQYNIKAYNKAMADQHRLGGSTQQEYSRYSWYSTRRQDVEIDEPKIQKGLLQNGKVLEFVHDRTALIHKNLLPEAIMINAKFDAPGHVAMQIVPQPKTIGQWISEHLVVLSNGESPQSLYQNIVLPRHIQLVSRSDITERVHT
ncbi:hypothetical protein RUND412_009486, partial [Rhizina undulata]